MLDYSNYDYLVFDCDGVIFDSNSLKSKAFAEALPDEPLELVKTFIEYHKQHGGISRYEKFKYYFADIQKCTDSEDQINTALLRFSRIVKKGLLECNFVPGIKKFLKQQYDFGMPLFVVSGSDQIELQEIFMSRDIMKYFKKVYGSPATKNENTAKVIHEIGKQKKGCFFGDSRSDYDAANKYELNFVYVSEFSEWKKGNKISEISIKNFISS